MTLIWVGDNPPTLYWFSLNNSKMVKAVTLALAAFSNFSLETLVPNLVSLICPSPQILRRNSDGGISDFRISGKSLINKNCHNSRTSDDFDMKLGSVIKTRETRQRQ